jgi:hypothetical protein
VSGDEAWYLAVLTFAAFWAAISAAMVIGSVHEGAKGAAWFWAAVFAASSLSAAYCFGMLIWGAGGAAWPGR